ncbi:hypothetical protein CLOSTMETH_03390 [[Clostridium] methylpentosum DSM 5476]|uniref:Uncharacterized protein n=1 Tax=[Clostridium] methylpentosum DSM 5476 TaxID=537013 RepID=C0EHP5_9FIRM|nr:hypothetical protein CLOSTMETH_03390 [[Clostridium] methylpentosum DSM 5476]
MESSFDRIKFDSTFNYTNFSTVCKGNVQKYSLISIIFLELSAVLPGNLIISRLGCTR